ncbi:hypothetical protein ABPG72_012625 [Tetrahymena utriculariae]
MNKQEFQLSSPQQTESVNNGLSNINPAVNNEKVSQRIQIQDQQHGFRINQYYQGQEQLLDQQMNLQDVEMDYNERINSMRELYEMRFQTLQETIRDVYEKVIKDDLIQTMKDNPISQEYIHQRVRELFEEIVLSEREVIIDKLSSQYTFLKAEFSKLENEKRRELQQHDEEMEESARIINMLKEDLHKERQNRQFYEQEFQRMQKKMNEVTEQFEDALIKKEQKLQDKLEQEQNQVIQLTQKFNDLEREYDQLIKSQNQIFSENQELKQRGEMMKADLSEKQLELNTYKIDLNTAEDKIKQQLKLNDNLKLEISQLSSRYNQLMEENTHLNMELENTKLDATTIESQMQQKFQHAQQNLQKGQEYLEKVKQKNKQKLEAYKNKIIEYKQRNQEAEQIIRQLKQEQNEEKDKSQKSLSNWERILQETKIEYERKIEEIHNVSQMKFDENQRRHDEYLQELQLHYQETMNQKIDDIKNESNLEIDQLRYQERQLKQMLEEKLNQLQKDYISKSLHDEIMDEKKKSIEKMKQDFDHFLSEFKKETELKNEQIELRKNKEHEQQLAYLQNNLKELEESLREYKLQGRELQSKNEQLEDSQQKIIADLENQIKQNRIYESEIQRLQEKLNKQKNKNTELQKTLDDLDQLSAQFKSDLESSRSTIQRYSQDLENITVQNEKLFAQINEQKQKNAELIGSVSNLKTEVSNGQQVIQFKEEVIKNIKESLEELKQENKQLNTKFFDLYKEKAQKNEDESKRFEEINTQITRLQYEAQEKSHQSEILKSQLDAVSEQKKLLEEEIQYLKIDLLEKERISQASIREKLELENLFSKKLQQQKELKYQIKNELTIELTRLRKDLSQIQEFVQHQIKMKSNEIELWVKSIQGKSKDILNKQNNQLQERLQIVESEISRECEEQIQDYKHRFEQEISDLQQQKEREIKQLSDYVNKLSQANQDLINESKGYQEELNELKNQYDLLQQQNQNLQKSYDNAIKKSEQMEQQFDLRLSEYQQRKEESGLKRKQMVERELDIANEEIIQWKNKYQNLIDQMNKNVEQMQSQREIETETVRQKMNFSIQQLESQIEMFQQNELELRDSIAKQNEKINLLQKIIQEKEDDFEGLRKEKDQQIKSVTEVELEYKLKEEDLRKQKKSYDEILREQEEKINHFVNEITILNSKINQLIEEKTILINKNKDLQFQLDLKQSQLNQLAKEFHDKQAKSNKEIEDLHKLLTQSFKNMNDNSENIDLARKLDEETRLLTKKVKDLQHINRYLEISKSPSSKSGVAIHTQQTNQNSSFQQINNLSQNLPTYQNNNSSNSIFQNQPSYFGSHSGSQGNLQVYNQNPNIGYNNINTNSHSNLHKVNFQNSQSNNRYDPGYSAQQKQQHQILQQHVNQFSPYSKQN